jgi:hypothetical protein
MSKNRRGPSSPASASQVPCFNADEQRTLEMFRVYLGYADRENELMHQRATLLTAIEAALMATFGYCYLTLYTVQEKIAESPDKDRLTLKMQEATLHFEHAMTTLAIPGIVTAVFGLVSITAGVTAQRVLEQEWTLHFHAKAAAIHLPFIAGGAKNRVVWTGDMFAQWFPILLIAFWLFALFLVLWKVEYPSSL